MTAPTADAGHHDPSTPLEAAGVRLDDVAGKLGPRRLGSIRSRGRWLDILQGKDLSGRPVISLELDGRHFSMVSVDRPDQDCAPGEFFAKTHEENAPFRELLLDLGLFVDTGRRIDCPHPDLERWRLVA